MIRNLSSFERLVRFLLAAFFLFAAAALYTHPAARIAAAVFGLFALGEGLAAKCGLTAALGVRAPAEKWKPEQLHLLGLSAVQFVIGYEWWSAGWEKVSNPDFVATIGKTLGYFASSNPFPAYKGFLEGIAMKHASLFAYAVEWGQVAVAAVLAGSAVTLVYAKRDAVKRKAFLLSVLALAGGMLMNANFYLASGWTGPGTKGVNVIMFWVQAVLAYAWLSAFLVGQGGIQTVQEAK